MPKSILVSANGTGRWVCISNMSVQPSVVKFGKCKTMISKGGVLMSFVVIGRINLCFKLCRKVSDWLLLPFHRHYKNKRPPPVPGEPFNGSVSIWFSHTTNPL